MFADFWRQTLSFLILLLKRAIPTPHAVMTSLQVTSTEEITRGSQQQPAGGGGNGNVSGSNHAQIMDAAFAPLPAMAPMVPMVFAPMAPMVPMAFASQHLAMQQQQQQFHQQQQQFHQQQQQFHQQQQQQQHHMHGQAFSVAGPGFAASGVFAPNSHAASQQQQR